MALGVQWMRTRLSRRRERVRRKSDPTSVWPQRFTEGETRATWRLIQTFETADVTAEATGNEAAQPSDPAWKIPRRAGNSRIPTPARPNRAAARVADVSGSPGRSAWANRPIQIGKLANRIAVRPESILSSA